MRRGNADDLKVPSLSHPRPGILIAALWCACVGTGFAYAWRYEATPGQAASQGDWPAGTAFERDAARPTIVTFVHPDCPCSKAGLSGLAETVAAHPSAAKLIVVVVGAPEMTKALANGTNTRLAGSIPGATVAFDPKGDEAKRFDAATSGQTFVFGPKGETLFKGGLTESRGHFGPSQGLDALKAILEHRPAPTRTAPVFGCALRQETSR